MSNPGIKPLRISPQWRLITPGTETKIALIELQNYSLILQEFDYDFMTAQGEQDMFVSLVAGVEIFRSGNFTVSDNGKIKSYVATVVSEKTGLPYSGVSSSTGAGVIHNESPQAVRLPLRISPNTLVYALVKNQSAYFSHAIRMTIAGLLIQE